MPKATFAETHFIS